MRFSLTAPSNTLKIKFEEPLSPSMTWAGAMEIEGAASSSLIVPVPVAVPRAAFVGFFRVTATVWFGSSVRSPRTETVISRRVAPGGKVSVPAASAA